jgi:hypothetical protein
MALDTVKLFTPAPSLWDLAETLGGDLTYTRHLVDMLGPYLEQIPDLTAQGDAFALLSALRKHLAPLGELESALQLAHGLRD